MVTSKRTREIQSGKLKSIAKEATSAGFAQALASDLSVVYAEGDALVEQLPGGKKKTLSLLKREKRTITNKFKLK